MNPATTSGADRFQTTGEMDPTATPGAPGTKTSTKIKKIMQLWINFNCPAYIQNVVCLTLSLSE